jgi:PIN domain-containing protein
LTYTLKSRYVFVDTQAFVRHGIQLERASLKRLKELASLGMINLVLTDVVIREVESKIEEKINNSKSLMNKFLKESEVIGGKISGLVSTINEELADDHFENHGKAIWREYISQSRATVIPSDLASTSELLSHYFKGNPPFSSKKKSEFPDAISLLSLKSWADKKEDGIYVVSGDGDVENWCKSESKYYYLKSLNDFIDLYNKTEEKLTYLAHEIFKKEQDWLLSVIEDEFKECEFSFRPDDGAYVDNISVKDIEFHELNVIEVDDERALLNLGVKIDFSANVSGEDYSSATWDSVDKEYIHIPSYSGIMEEDEYFEVTVEVYMNTTEKVFDHPEIILFDDSRTIEFGYDDWPYK